MASRARCGSGSVSASAIRSARRSGLTVNVAVRSAIRFRRRRPDPVQREDDADDPGRVVDQPLDQRQPLARAKERQEA